MVMEENAPRNQWMMGKVTKTVASKDGLVRKAAVMIGSRDLDKQGKRIHKLSTLERPIQKLVLLQPQSSQNTQPTLDKE